MTTVININVYTNPQEVAPFEYTSEEREAMMNLFKDEHGISPRPSEQSINDMIQALYQEGYGS